LASVALLAFGASGLLDAWGRFAPELLLLLVVLLPGWVIAPLFCSRERLGAPDRIALALVLSIFVLDVAMVPLLAFELPLDAARWLLAGIYLVAALASLGFDTSRGARGESTGAEWLAWLVAAASLVPVVVRYGGGGVDDWWDLAYVRALADRAALDFAEPMLGTGAVHPRFAWNAWSLLQAFVLDVAGGEPVEIQAYWLAPIVSVASVAAVLALARSVFGNRDRSARLAAVLILPVWLFGTEALPYFTRVHQDKFVAALVMMPVLLASALDYLERPSGRRLFAVACYAVTTCSVHSLVFGVAALGVAVCAIVAHRAGRERRGWYTVPSAAAPTRNDLVKLAFVGAAVAALPAYQALALRGWFAGGQVAIAVRDNPVVRAHLALDRLIAPDTWHMIVSPAALFGPVGVFCIVGALAALGRKRVGDRYLLALTLAPAILIFVPLVASAVGKLAVPWMLYRIGWLIPQPLLLARALLAVAGREPGIAGGARVAAMALVMIGVALPVAADRIRRDMREHPYVRELEPRGTTLDVYRFLRGSAERSTVLAQPGFSSLVPALTGRTVVAFSERGTLVFARDEEGAYGRIHDRGEFFSCAADVATRERIARRYDVGHVVFRRRYVPAGDERAWLDRANAEGLLMSADASVPIECSATRTRLEAGLPRGWLVVHENEDYFVVAVPKTEPATAHEGASHATDWSSPFALSILEPAEREDVLASATGFPGGRMRLLPPPATFGVSDAFAWSGGGALWDDGPFEVAIEMTMAGVCPVSTLEIVPYLETSRREVLEIRLEGKSWRVRARDGETVRLALDGKPRSGLRVELTSLFGLTFGLADLRLLGDRTRCDEQWVARPGPDVEGATPSIDRLADLISRYPRAPQLVAALARRRRDSASPDDAITLLRRALARDGRQAAPWIEYGLLLDASGRVAEARSAYARARAADSNSPWAHGCLAWADLRSGSPLRALWHSWRAYRLDRRYADALTIRGLALEALGFTRASAQAFERAIALAPRRSWPYLELARQLAASGARDEARTVLTRYLAASPADESVRTALEAIDGGGNGGGA
jgi:tetratricopeptide (TPR) repeat protein